MNFLDYIKEGSICVCRDRSRVTVECILKGDEQPIVARTEDRKVRRYDAEGFLNGPAAHHDHDLIAIV